MARVAQNSDREELGALWRLCFGDPPCFVDWFMTQRFLPEYCMIVERDGRIAAALHALPQHIRIRDAILPCAVLGGVATHPAYRGQGLMHELMTYFMDRMRLYGVPLIPHRPAKLTTFFSLGHYPVSDSQYVSFCGAPIGPDECVQTDMRADASALYRCYAAFARGYSGMIQRSYADLVLKCADYLSCDAQCIALWGDTGVEGYCIYFVTEEEIYGEECVALSPAAYTRLFRGMTARAAGKPLRMRLPSDVQVEGAGESVIEPRSVLGVADASALLRATGLAGSALAVTDKVVAQNNGVFTLQGERTTQAPALRISAGRLAQWAVGYTTMAALVEAGEAEALAPDAVRMLDSIGRRACYIVDEY